MRGGEAVPLELHLRFWVISLLIKISWLQPDSGEILNFRWRITDNKSKRDNYLNCKVYVIKFKYQCRVKTKFSFVVMQGKGKSSECHTSLLLLFSCLSLSTSYTVPYRSRLQKSKFFFCPFLFEFSWLEQNVNLITFASVDFFAIGLQTITHMQLNYVY